MTSTRGVLSVGDEPPPLATTKPKVLPGGRNGKASRFAVLNAFLDMTLRDLDRAAAAVWLLLYRDTKADGLARTSQADLARRAGVNVRTVRRAMDKLYDLGLLSVVRRGSIRSGLSTYRVHPLVRPP